MKPALSFFLIAPLLLMSAGCTSTQESAIFTAINTAINAAGTLLGVAQSFGALDTPQARADVTAGEEAAQQVSMAASQALAEYQSDDSDAIKIVKIGEIASSIAPIPATTTQKINAALDPLANAVASLLAAIKASATTPAIVTAHANMASVSPSTPKFHLTAYFPGTSQHKARALKAKADANILLAAQLLGLFTPSAMLPVSPSGFPLNPIAPDSRSGAYWLHDRHSHN